MAAISANPLDREHTLEPRAGAPHGGDVPSSGRQGPSSGGQAHGQGSGALAAALLADDDVTIDSDGPSVARVGVPAGHGLPSAALAAESGSGWELDGHSLEPDVSSTVLAAVEVDGVARAGLARYVFLLLSLLAIGAVCWLVSQAPGLGIDQVERGARTLGHVLVLGVPVAAATWTTGRIGGWLAAIAAAFCVAFAAFAIDDAPRAALATSGALSGVLFVGMVEALRRHRLRRDHARALSEQIEALAASRRAMEQHDRATGLLHEAALRERLSEEVLRSSRYSHPLSLVRLSVSGDERDLVEVARVVERVRRSTDFGARLDDDTLVVVLAETGYGDAEAFATRVHDAIVEVRGASAHAIGVTSWPDPLEPPSSLTGGRLLSSARLALDAAESAGAGAIVATAV